MNSTKSRSDIRLKFEKVPFIIKEISKEFQILLNYASNLAYIVAPTQQNCCHPKLISKLSNEPLITGSFRAKEN